MRGRNIRLSDWEAGRHRPVLTLLDPFVVCSDRLYDALPKRLNAVQTKSLKETTAMTRATAERVIQGLLVATAALNDTLLIVEMEAPEAFPEFRKHSGQVMGAIYLDLMKRIVAQYPDLDPGTRD